MTDLDPKDMASFLNELAVNKDVNLNDETRDKLLQCSLFIHVVVSKLERR